MEKLELKYLAPYLPYSLKFKTDFDHLQYLMTSLDIHKSKVTFRAVNNFKNSKTIAVKLLGDNKPILRPLSDLNTIIEHNNIKFNPIETYKGFKDLELIQITEVVLWQHTNISTYNFLIRHHFDVFGLISKGLAIDINTLKK